MTDSDLFLDAWIRGVELAGRDLFGDGSDPRLAANRDELRPDFERIENAIEMKSYGEAVFIIAMLSFFNSQFAGEIQDSMPRQAKTMASIVVAVDENRRAVLRDLFDNYRGW